MAAVLEGTMGFEAFLEWEAKQERKHYLHEGRVYATAGASRNHASITPMLTTICNNQLRGKPCRYRDTDTKVFVARTGSVYYPDGLIACPPNYVGESQGAIDNPAAIFEVLSPSTGRFDREGKFDAYRLLDSLRDYVLISSTRGASRFTAFGRTGRGATPSIFRARSRAFLWLVSSCRWTSSTRRR